MSMRAISETAISTEILVKRDLINFIKLREAHPHEDAVIGELLVRTFHETYSAKLPKVVTSFERERELRDVPIRRQQGCVRVLELGYQIIGTYTLIRSGTDLDDSWSFNTTTLRFVAIDPKFHALRLSDTLIRDAINLAHAWQSDAICLHVQQGAVGVARLYQRHGFLRAPEGDKLSFGNFVEGYLLPIVASQTCEL